MNLVNNSFWRLEPSRATDLNAIPESDVLTPPDFVVAKIRRLDGIVMAIWDDDKEHGRVHALGIVKDVKDHSVIVDWRRVIFTLEPSRQGASKWRTKPLFKFAPLVAERYGLMDRFHAAFANESVTESPGVPAEKLPFATDPNPHHPRASATIKAKSRSKQGHLFIINGDLTEIAADAILIPTDRVFKIEPAWQDLVWPKMDQIKHHSLWEPSDWRGVGVVELPHGPREPRIWLGDIGRVGNHSDWAEFAPVVEEFIATATASSRSISPKERIYNWPKRRLALHIVGSGEGGARHQQGQLVTGLVTKLQSLAVDHDVDIVLVARGDKKFAAAQRARHQILKQSMLTPTDVWTFDENDTLLHDQARKLSEHAVNGQLVLFIGSGVSAGAGLPTWQELIERLAVQAHIDSAILKGFLKKDLRDQATILERRWERECGVSLRDALAEQLHTNRYALAHGLLASLSAKEAVTTNFDTLFEKASQGAGKELAVLPANPQETAGRWLLKLHGTVDEPATIIFTRSDFLEMPRQHRALMGLVQGLLMMRHLLFVGYSLTDEDFHELIHELRTARGNNVASIVRGTVLTLRHDKLDQELWADDLGIVPMSTREGTGTETSARQMEMFLDLVAYHSTTSASFFLDTDYDSLSEDESALRTSLKELIKATANKQSDTVAHKVWNFLAHELGADRVEALPHDRLTRPGSTAH
jgi:hypothetical protein